MENSTLGSDPDLAVTHSVFNLKSISIPPYKMTWMWRKTCTGIKFDLQHFNGSQTKFICDSLYKHPVFNSSQCNTNYVQIVQVPGSRDPGVSAAGSVLGVQHAAAEPGYQQTSPCSQHDCRHGVTSVIIILLHYDNNIYPEGVPSLPEPRRLPVPV